MSESIQSVRGMNDYLPPDTAKWGFFERRCRELFERHGYEEIRTPVVEHTALFDRGIGEATDIVEKEMYTFSDRKGRSLTMRPEMTASCVRAVISGRMVSERPLRSENVYISFSTMSVASPMPRSKSAVCSTTGVRISS